MPKDLLSPDPTLAFPQPNCKSRLQALGPQASPTTARYTKNQGQKDCPVFVPTTGIYGQYLLVQIYSQKLKLVSEICLLVT